VSGKKKELKRAGISIYYEPVTLICTPKEVIFKILDEIFKVIIA
jgi:hypothetical protein